MIDLLEETRVELINKSKEVDKVKSYDSTRYERRTHQKESTNTSLYNKIDMTGLFVANILSFKVPVIGETNSYEVDVMFENVCEHIKEELKRNNYKVEYKCIYRAIIRAINEGDVLVSCTCPDFKYRFSYYATKGKYNSGAPEVRPARITNPNDSKGKACKHALEVLSNLGWALNLAQAICNYIKYMEKNYAPKFVKIIFPAIFDIPYEEYSNDTNQYGVGDHELANSKDNPEDTEVIDDANRGEQEDDT